MTTRRKSKPGKNVTVDLPYELIEQIKAEAQIHERSVSYMVQWAWRLSRDTIKRIKEPS